MADSDAYVVGYWAENHGLAFDDVRQTPYAKVCRSNHGDFEAGRDDRKVERAGETPRRPKPDVAAFMSSMKDVAANGGLTKS